MKEAIKTSNTTNTTMACGVLSTVFEQHFYTAYFLVHIPLTIFIDSTICLPPMTDGLKAMIEWHVAENNDFLLLEKPAWFFWMVVVELLFQLPAFPYFIARMSLFRGDAPGTSKEEKAARAGKRGTLRTLLRLYGLNASLTSLFCIYVIYERGYYPATGAPLSAVDCAKLIAYYTPTFLIPLRLCFV